MKKRRSRKNNENKSHRHNRETADTLEQIDPNTYIIPAKKIILHNKTKETVHFFTPNSFITCTRTITPKKNRSESLAAEKTWKKSDLTFPDACKIAESSGYLTPSRPSPKASLGADLR